MKATGVVRKLDMLGRVVMPKELRDVLNINVGDSVEIFTDDNMIILKKYEPACIFCGDASNVYYFKGRNVCRNCIAELKD